jgi:alpha-tubulin suppressor-like RCC1 family protein
MDIFRLRSYLASKALLYRLRRKESRRPQFLLILIAGLGGLTLSGSRHSSLGIYAWGDNAQGQLATSSSDVAGRLERITLPSGLGPEAVSAGSYHSLAVGSDEALFAWGGNRYGQLGDGTTTARARPERIVLAPGVTPVAISAGGQGSMAIGSDGQLYAWGSGMYGQLGDGTTGADRLRPEKIVLADGVAPVAISDGYDAALAIGSNGRLYAWGSNLFGQLGDGTRATFHAWPEQITLAPGVVPKAISAGYQASLAVGSDGRLYSWGDNCCGQIGDGTHINRTTPERVTLALGVAPTAISEGGESLVIGSDGRIYGWGQTTPVNSVTEPA